MNIRSKIRNHFILDLGHSQMTNKQLFDAQQPLLGTQNQSCPGLLLKGGVQTARIHSQVMNQKREQKILTSHKKKRIAASNQHQLPSLGCSQRSEKMVLRFPPQKIKKNFLN